MRSRFFGAGSYDDDEEDDYDMSGFVADQVPPKPPIVERAREVPPPPVESAEPMGASYAGPTNRVRTNPAASINYAPNFSTDQTDSWGWVQPLNPLWASTEAYWHKLAVFSKTAGLSTLMISGFPAAKARMLGKWGTAFSIGSAAYLFPVLGYHHGVLDKAVGDKDWYIEYPVKILTHGLVGYGMYKLMMRY